MSKEFNHSMPIDDWAAEMGTEVFETNLMYTLKEFCPTVHGLITTDTDKDIMLRHLRFYLREWHLSQTE